MPNLAQNALSAYQNSPQDDQPLSYVRRDLSGGQDNRHAGTELKDNQATVLYNADIGTPGETRKRPGLTLLDTLSGTGTSLAAFQPVAGTNQIVATDGTNLSTSTGTTFTHRKTNFTSTPHPIMITNGKAGGVSLGAPTITVATPAVVTLASHGLIVGEAIFFTTTGALPTGITANTVYFVISAGFTTGAFEISTTAGGSAVNTSGSQSGTHSLFRQSSYSSGDCLFVGDGTDNWYMMAQDYTFVDLGNKNTSPPLGNVAAPYNSRIFVQVKNKLYWSDAFSSDYSTSFDRTSNFYNIPVGNEKAIIALRNEGLICFGSDKVIGITPSSVPAATDISQYLYDRGCVAGRTVCQAADDIYFLSQDGVRGLFRSQQDKLQMGESFPVSYNLKAEFESLSWAFIDGACSVFYDNKVFFSVPVNASTFNNQVWVYYPATQGWMVINGWNVSAWAKVTINGQELLYATDSNSGKVYKAWQGFNDNGTAISYQEESKKDDLQQPLVTKWGGYLKLRVYSTGSYTLSVFANPDDQGYTQLGTITTPGAGAGLPITLPFTLTNAGVTEQSFPLDDLGPWKTLTTKITHTALNTEDIKIYERNLVTYADLYLP